jgi:hypothetical protein
MAAPNICKPSVWNLLHVTILAPRILGYLLRFLENLCALFICKLKTKFEVFNKVLELSKTSSFMDKRQLISLYLPPTKTFTQATSYRHACENRFDMQFLSTPHSVTPGSRDSSDGIATCYGLDGPCFKSQ